MSNLVFAITILVMIMVGYSYSKVKNPLITFWIFVALAVFWIASTLIHIFNTDKVILILVDEYPKAVLSYSGNAEILKGQKITAEFKAKHNYLGVVGLRFWNYYRLNSDYINFKIKQKGQDNWYFQSKHKVDQFQPDRYFVFGIPPISDSVGKTYEIEIESENGIPGNAIGISKMNPSMIVKYKFPRSQLSTPSEIVSFATKKSINILSRIDIVAYSFIYFLPLAIFSLYSSRNFWPNKSPINKLFSIETSGFVSLALLLVAVLLDIFKIREGVGTISIICAIWIFSSTVYRYTTKKIVVMSALFYCLSFIFALFQNHPFGVVERFMVWAYLFMCYVVISNFFSINLNYIRKENN